MAPIQKWTDQQLVPTDPVKKDKVIKALADYLDKAEKGEKKLTDEINNIIDN